jgi:hypothetical protein
MKDYELQNVNWKFVNIKNGEKIPIGMNWQKNPNIITEIYTDNVGVVLGPASHGLCAIDVDGEEALDHFNNTFPNIDLANIDTAMWSSGKPYRFQAAFIVPKIYWTSLKRKVVNKLEFRWTNTQSVLPPSKLNDGREYIWLKKPSVVGVKELPEEILVYWLQLMYDELTKYDTTPVTEYDVKMTDEEVNTLLEKIKNKVGDLKGDYDVWRTIAWATCSTVGIQTAEMLMKYYWPYKTNKEIVTLRAWKSSVNGPKIGTLIKLSGVSTDERKLLEIQAKIRKLK